MNKKTVCYTDSIDLGRKLKQYRMSMGLTLKDASELLGIGASTLDKWESTVRDHNLTHGRALVTMGKLETGYGIELVLTKEVEEVKKNEFTSNEEEHPNSKIIFVEVEEGITGREASSKSIVVAKSMSSVIDIVDRCWENIRNEAGSSWANITGSGIVELVGGKVPDNVFLFVNLNTYEYIKYKINETSFGPDGTATIYNN